MTGWISGENRLRGDNSPVQKFADHVQMRICRGKKLTGIQSMSILDFGCGDAAISEIIGTRCQKIQVCDITDAYITKERYNNFNFCLVEELEKKHDVEVFDMIYSFGVVQYLSTDEFALLNTRLLSLLQPGGAIIHCNILDRGKMFDYYHRPNNIKNIFRFFASGAFRSVLTGRIWSDGSRWHNVSKLQALCQVQNYVLPGYSRERTDLVLEKS